jgi:carbonic anhydrase
MCTECGQDASGGVSRRGFLGIVGGAAAGLAAGTARADECAPFLADSLAATTPDMALRMLAEGNARFAAGQSLRCDLLTAVEATAAGQTPFACVLSCIDSRVPTEMVFDQQLGDIFVARVAGNVPTAEILGSFEYATKVAGAKAIVVLGHTHCGAIKGAIDRARVGDNLTTLLNEIEPAVLSTHVEGERSSHNHALVEAVCERNVEFGVVAMILKSKVLKDLMVAGDLRLMGAIYDIDTGRVRFLA